MLWSLVLLEGKEGLWGQLCLSPPTGLSFPTKSTGPPPLSWPGSPRGAVQRHSPSLRVGCQGSHPPSPWGVWRFRWPLPKPDAKVLWETALGMTIPIHRMLVTLSKKGCHVPSPPSRMTGSKQFMRAGERLAWGHWGGDGAVFSCCSCHFLTPLPLLQK